MKLVERAKALLARRSPGASLGELHLQAMKLLVEKLEREQFAVTDRPRTPQPRKPGQSHTPEQQEAQPRTREAQQQEAQPHTPRPHHVSQRQAQEQQHKSQSRRGRRIPSAVKREVFLRDGGCCSYVDKRGERCEERRYLELHHLQPFAQGGDHAANNLSLRCSAHNALAAEEDFGRERVEQERDSVRHESFGAHVRPKGAPSLVPDD